MVGVLTGHRHPGATPVIGEDPNRRDPKGRFGLLRLLAGDAPTTASHPASILLALE
jgi:hypothetical protein